MKKNEFATFVAYLAMFGVAILVGLVWLRPVISEVGSTLGIHYILLVILSLLSGVIINSLLIELGHLLGAKTGKYEVRAWTVLFFGFQKKNGKKKWGFHQFDGLSGETKLKPMDVEKSSLSGYIAFPLLFLLAEVVACAFMIAISVRLRASSDESVAGIGWMHVFALVLLGTAAMLYIYDFFPAHLETNNDGYLAIVLSKPINKVAFNNMLLADAIAEEGGTAPQVPVYETVTDFTFRLNLVSAYQAIQKGDSRKAIHILDMAINTDKGLSSGNKMEASALKLSILLREGRSEGKTMFEEMSDEQKKYISSVASMPALRCYLLISGLIEDAENEANFALGKVEKAIKDCEKSWIAIEKALIAADIQVVMKKHPTWQLEPLPWAEKEAKEEPKE